MNHIFQCIKKLQSEPDVTSLRNPTKDKRAFRRMLTSADRAKQISYPESSGFLVSGQPAGDINLIDFFDWLCLS